MLLWPQHIVFVTIGLEVRVALPGEGIEVVNGLLGQAHELVPLGARHQLALHPLLAQVRMKVVIRDPTSGLSHELRPECPVLHFGDAELRRRGG